MTPYSKAIEIVLSHPRDYGTEHIPLKKAVGRVLAQDVKADRDFPPFNRATKDGIALNFNAVENGRKAFEINGVLAAGTPAAVLEDQEACLEIMTGATVPYDADTVVMYEHIELNNGIATLKTIPEKGQNIHYRGSDIEKGEVVLQANTPITPAAIGVLASVGMVNVPVKKLPRVAVISTGNELVDIDMQPETHQIRRSNTYSLHAALSRLGIEPMMLHLQDDKDMIRQKLAYVVEELDVLLLSGGVSKGKFDHLPEVLQDIGIEKCFHRVLQRPGKPFWFGYHPIKGTIVFSFPGNPVSTYANYHLYFRPWLERCLGLDSRKKTVMIDQDISMSGTLTRFVRVTLNWEQGQLWASLVNANGSGDLISLAQADGLIQLDPEVEHYSKGALVPYHPFHTFDL